MLSERTMPRCLSGQCPVVRSDNDMLSARTMLRCQFRQRGVPMRRNLTLSVHFTSNFTFEVI
jgi:hypothetical protein